MDSQNSIAWLRNELGLSQVQMAKLLELDRSTLAHYETGNRNPDNLNRNRFVVALRCLGEARSFQNDLPSDITPGPAYRQWVTERTAALKKELEAAKEKKEKLEKTRNKTAIQKTWFGLLKAELTSFNQTSFENLFQSMEIEWNERNEDTMKDQISILDTTIQLLSTSINLLEMN